MAKLFKITKGSYSRREDGKFALYSARGEKNIIRLEEETYKHLKERLGLVPHTVNAKKKQTAKPNGENNPNGENKSNEGSE